MLTDLMRNTVLVSESERNTQLIPINMQHRPALLSLLPGRDEPGEEPGAPGQLLESGLS